MRTPRLFAAADFLSRSAVRTTCHLTLNLHMIFLLRKNIRELMSPQDLNCCRTRHIPSFHVFVVTANHHNCPAICRSSPACYPQVSLHCCSKMGFRFFTVEAGSRLAGSEAAELRAHLLLYLLQDRKLVAMTPRQKFQHMRRDGSEGLTLQEAACGVQILPV